MIVKASGYPFYASVLCCFIYLHQYTGCFFKELLHVNFSLA